jgi:hypothetical protein
MFSQLIEECRYEVTFGLSEGRRMEKFKDAVIPGRKRKKAQAARAFHNDAQDALAQTKDSTLRNKLRSDRENKKKAQHASDYHPDAVRERKQKAAQEKQQHRRKMDNDDAKFRADVAARKRDPNPHKSWH